MLKAHSIHCSHFLWTARARPLHKAPARTTRLRISADSALTTPHSGYHFDGSNRRFFEGWYFKVGKCQYVTTEMISIEHSYVCIRCLVSGQVSLPEPGHAFAFIYSVEDPGGGSEKGGVGAQVIALYHINAYFRF